MQEAKQYRYAAHEAEESIKRYQKIEQLIAQYRGEHPFVTPNRVMIGKKEERRKYIAAEVAQAIKNSEITYKIGTWLGVPIFLKVNLNLASPYTLAIADSYRGCEMSCYANWLEKDNQWRFDDAIEQFFAKLTSKINTAQEGRKSALEKSEQFEEQAHTVFPQQHAWQIALARKQELDHYIDSAANAKGEEDLQQLAERRARLLASVPKELTERPKPKNTATYVLPPRNPAAQHQDEAVSKDQIAVEQTEAKELSIEEIARAIQQSHLVGSQSAVSFGNLEHIQRNKKRKRGKNTSIPPQPKAQATKKQLANGEKFPKSSQSNPAITGKQTPTHPSTLWDLLTEEATPTPVEPRSASASSPEQLTLF